MIFTKQQFDNEEPIPEQLESQIFNNSEGEMMDDNWSDYIEAHLIRHFNICDEYEYSQ